MDLHMFCLFPLPLSIPGSFYLCFSFFLNLVFCRYRRVISFYFLGSTVDISVRAYILGTDLDPSNQKMMMSIFDEGTLQEINISTWGKGKKSSSNMPNIRGILVNSLGPGTHSGSTLEQTWISL